MSASEAPRSAAEAECAEALAVLQAALSLAAPRPGVPHAPSEAGLQAAARLHSAARALVFDSPPSDLSHLEPAAAEARGLLAAVAVDLACLLDDLGDGTPPELAAARAVAVEDSLTAAAEVLGRCRP